MVTLAVLGIAIAIALPAFQQMLGQNRRSEAAAELYQALVLARGEAVARNASLTLRASPEGWGAGWALFIDSDGDGEPDDTLTGDAMLLERDYGKVPVDWLTDPADLEWLRIGRNGRVVTPARWVLCGPDAGRSRRLDASPAAPPRLDNLAATPALHTELCE